MPRKPSRRTFLKLSAAAASVSAARLGHAAPPASSIRVEVDPAFAATASIQWAVSKVKEAWAARGVVPRNATAEAHYEIDNSVISIVPSEVASKRFSVRVPAAPETAALAFWWLNNSPFVTIVTGSDIRGIVYALLELADRIRTADDPIAALRLPAPIIETTQNKVRSVMRMFCSEVEDKPWFYDHAFWTTYLDTLAAARFNRFNLAFGLAYDFPRGVTDDYFHFPYPYLVEVPGYEQVHVEPALAPGERQRNLETLQFIAAEIARRGLDFQLGLWTHAYQWTDSPNSAHHIVGITPQTHAAYCRDALAALLKACPQITGLTMRIHGESGIPEGSYPFWQTLFDAIPAARTPDGKPRVIEIDMHAKGLNQIMIDMARKTGMPVKAGAKFWAEHLGLGYQQADIRATEYPRQGVTGTFAVSAGARNFTRYGYGDFYQYPQGLPPGQSIDLLYRVWPGTQRHLLWADPALASGYGHAANFCGAAGMELMEPLSFKGREGSGHPGGRNAYVDKTLSASSVVIPQRTSAEESASRNAGTDSQIADLDSAKFDLTYLTWGRGLYNPDAAPDFYHRALRAKFGAAGPALGDALAASSRILPLVTTAWCPSASNHEFWPEMFTPVSLLPYTTRPLYTDSPAPHNVSAISPLDPQLFTTIDQHAKDLVSGTPNARYNSSWVIQWLMALWIGASNSLKAARTAAGPRANSPEFRRIEEDVLIAASLGEYFSNTFSAGLYYSIYVQNHDPEAADRSLNFAQLARDAWANIASRAQKTYASDVSYGSLPYRRGNWADRLPAIDTNLAALKKYFADNSDKSAERHSVAVQFAIAPPERPAIAANHTPAKSFHPGSDLTLLIKTQPGTTEAILWYRHVNHGERWLSKPMEHVESRAGDLHSAAIPAAYTNSPYPLQYYFELHTASAATLHPALNPTLSNQPYFAVYKRT